MYNVLYIENVLLENGSSFYLWGAATTIGRGYGIQTTTTT